MCTSCEGMIPIDAEICPYCAADHSQSTEQTSSYQAPLFKHQSLEESLTSLYTPPYSSKNHAYATEENKAPPPRKNRENPTEGMMSAIRKEAAPSLAIPTSATEETEEEQSAQGSTFWAVFMLSLGAVLLNLGVLQLFFSDHGVLKLEWNGAYWFLYCLVSVPLFYLGFKKVNTLR